MNILFLDYDGVVNTPMWDEKKHKVRYNLPEDGKVNNFQAVQWISCFCKKNNFSIVVSSSWRDEDNYEKCLRNGGLWTDIKIVGVTPFLSSGNRQKEIEQWLSEHPEVENYLIVDDLHYEGFDSKHFIKCDSHIGFTYRKYLKANKLYQKLKKKDTINI